MARIICSLTADYIECIPCIALALSTFKSVVKVVEITWLFSRGLSWFELLATLFEFSVFSHKFNKKIAAQLAFLLITIITVSVKVAQGCAQGGQECLLNCRT